MVTINPYYHYYLHHELNPQRPNPGQGEKIKLNFYFHTSLCCLKKGFMKALHKTFWDTTKKCENKNLN